MHDEWVMDFFMITRHKDGIHKSLNTVIRVVILGLVEYLKTSSPTSSELFFSHPHISNLHCFKR